MVLTTIQIIVIAIAVVLALWMVIRKTRQSELAWKPALLIGAASATIGLLGLVSSYPLLFRSFNTAWTLEMFQAMMLVGLLIGLIGIFIGSTFESAVLLAIRPDCLTAFSRANRRKLGRDALMSAVVGVAAFLFMAHFRAFLASRFHAYSSPDLSAPASFAALAPALNEISSAVSSWLMWSVTIAFISFVAFKYVKRPWLIGLATLVATAGFAEGHTVGEFLLQYSAALVTVALYGAILLGFFRRNYFAYGLWIWSVMLGNGAHQLASQPASSFQIQGWIAAAFLLLTLVWAALPVFTTPKPKEAQAAGQA
jgi:hypothetical protein